MQSFTRCAICALFLFGATAPLSRATDEAEIEKLKEGWEPLFDGKTLSGWKAADNPESWTALPDGTIRGKGPRSHLFSPKEYTDFAFRADVKASKGTNSGMYFRTAFGPEWPKGYEAQVNNSGGDPKRTGSLYNFVDIREQLVPDDTWWTQEILCKGNHIIIKVNDKVVVDFVDETSMYKRGHFAFQQHDAGSEVYYKNVMVKDLSK
ncbi:MAG: DUF1080 domain-containing protein [Planctomycetota bacterium]